MREKVPGNCGTSKNAAPRSRVAAVVLAAGLSRRFGANKLLAQFDGKPLVRRAIDAALGSRLRSIVVVLGHQRDCVRQALADIEFDPRLTFVENPAYDRGQSGSVIAGLAAIPADAVGAMFLMGDQPLLQATVIDRLISEFEASGRDICCPSVAGRRRNPVIFGSRFFSRLRCLVGDTGGRDLIDANPDSVMSVAFTDEAAFQDVDSPDDLASLASELALQQQRGN